MRLQVRALILVTLVLAGCAGNRDYGRVQYLPEPVVESQEVTPPEKSLLQQEREKKLLETLSLAPTPLKAPDTIIRVFIFPWVDGDGVLHTAHYAFLKVDEGKWVLGDYLLKPMKEGERVKFPLHPQPRRQAGGKDEP